MQIWTFKLNTDLDSDTALYRYSGYNLSPPPPPPYLLLIPPSNPSCFLSAQTLSFLICLPNFLTKARGSNLTE